jgi:regulator of replication initiation timing
VTDLSTLQQRLQEMEAENKILQIENQRSVSANESAAKGPATERVSRRI